MLYIVFFLVLTYFILVHPDVSLYYAMHGMTLWYSKMVPSLLPFMILSGTLIRMNLSERFVSFLHPFVKRIYRCNPNVTYGILMGFLCGFPMGARVTSELLSEKKLTTGEGKFLLAFCNNIGPVYMCSFVIPALQLQNRLSVLAVMYGVPLLYGILLRYTVYRRELDDVYDIGSLQSSQINIKNPDMPQIPVRQFQTAQVSVKKFSQVFFGPKKSPALLDALDDAIRSGIAGITMLCGYMILFNLLNLLPYFFCPQLLKMVGPILEITGGIGTNTYEHPEYILILLPFGGLSCIAQTNSIIKDTGLSIGNYVIHKIITTVITAGIYILLF